VDRFLTPLLSACQGTQPGVPPKFCEQLRELAASNLSLVAFISRMIEDLGLKVIRERRQVLITGLVEAQIH
jgi:hypothetical protein